ncbi:MAG: hypothetical protein ACOVSW_18560 [Candidatus Kapaibacteriota bacterium]
MGTAYYRSSSVREACATQEEAVVRQDKDLTSSPTKGMGDSPTSIIEARD